MKVKLLNILFGSIILLVFHSCTDTTLVKEDFVGYQQTTSIFRVPISGNSFLTVKPSGSY